MQSSAKLKTDLCSEPWTQDAKWMLGTRSRGMTSIYNQIYEWPLTDRFSICDPTLTKDCLEGWPRYLNGPVKDHLGTPTASVTQSVKACPGAWPQSMSLERDIQCGAESAEPRGKTEDRCYILSLLSRTFIPPFLGTQWCLKHPIIQFCLSSSFFISFFFSPVLVFSKFPFERFSKDQRLPWFSGLCLSLSWAGTVLGCWVVFLSLFLFSVYI